MPLGGLHSQSGLALQSLFLSAEFTQRPASPLAFITYFCFLLPVLIKYEVGMLVLAQPMGNLTFFLTAYIILTFNRVEALLDSSLESPVIVHYL